MMSEYKRLHPVSVVFSFLTSLKESFFPLIILMFFGKLSWFIKTFIIGTVVVFSFISGLVRWLRFTYRLEDSELRIEYGFFVKKKRYIPFRRIQSLDFSEGIVPRLFGLVKVKVETAGSNMDAEAELNMIKKEDALWLQNVIFTAKSEEKTDETNEHIEQEYTSLKQPAASQVYKVSNKDLFIMATTSGGIGVVVSAIAAFISQFDELIPYEKVFAELQYFIKSGVVFVTAIIFIGLFIAWIIANILTMLKYNEFTIIKKGEELIITRGLLEKRQTTIPMKRIQAVRVTENPIRQLFGYATVFIKIAGNAEEEEKGKGRVMLLPIIKKVNLLPTLKDLLPDYLFDLSVQPVPPRAKRRYIFIEMIWTIPVAIILSLLFWPYGLLGILLIVYGLLIGFARYRDAGWNIINNQLILQFREFSKHTMFMKKNRIQALNRRVSWFQKRADLASITATTMSGIVGAIGKVAHLEKTDVDHIYRWYSPERTNSLQEQEKFSAEKE